jgi:glycogen phosphorylase
MEHYLANYAQEKLGLSFRDLMALGRQNPQDDFEPFNMAYLAVRGSGAVNGVSRLHGQVSRRLFTPLFDHSVLTRRNRRRSPSISGSSLVFKRF